MSDEASASGSKTDPPLPKVEPISDDDRDSVTTHLSKGRK